jgi:hypothetical protein
MTIAFRTSKELTEPVRARGYGDHPGLQKLREIFEKHGVSMRYETAGPRVERAHEGTENPQKRSMFVIRGVKSAQEERIKTQLRKVKGITVPAKTPAPAR